MRTGGQKAGEPAGGLARTTPSVADKRTIRRGSPNTPPVEDGREGGGHEEMHALSRMLPMLDEKYKQTPR